MNQDLYKTILSRSMALASRREICIRDMREKVRMWGAGEKETEKIITTLIDEKFIDELRYAKAFVNDKFRYNKWGRIKLSAGLKMKGIKPELIREALGSIDDEQYRNTLESLLKLHGRSIKAKNDYEFRAKLMRFGQSRGFETGLLSDILGEEWA
ncbi:MAG TPA: regulatory protein RecX [Bacteroidales bacterium]|nr:regulatory protein RecX [Bacteroidales bacterium]